MLRSFATAVILAALLSSSSLLVCSFAPSQQLRRQAASSSSSSSSSSWGAWGDSRVGSGEDRRRSRRGRGAQSSAAAPSMMLEGLTERISGAVQSLQGTQRISEAAVAGVLKDVKRALLDSDVNLQVANAIVAGVKDRAVGVEVTKGVTAEQQFVKLMYDELVQIMGGDTTKEGGAGDDPAAAFAAAAKSSAAVLDGAREAGEKPQVVLMAGLQGAGKTTSAAKLALATVTNPKDGKPTGRGCLLAAADIYRPAAIKQLQTLGSQIGVEVFSMGTEVDPADIAKAALARAEELSAETGKPFTLIVDTAGRQVVDGPLMEELARVKQAVGPDETLLVVDAMTGQEAATLTDRFNKDVGISGAILTKLDGDTRGGAAISVKAVSGCDIKYVGMGEKMAPLEPFYADRLASRILGMGDVVSLVEKAQQKVSEEDALKTMQKMQDASFDFNDFVEQAKLVQNMGGAASMMSMLPGMGGAGISKEQIAAAEVRMKGHEAMINSMTKKERQDPRLLITDKSSRSRQMRIARGAGRDLQEAQMFLAEFQQMRTMMSRMSKGAAQGGSPDSTDPMAMAAAAGAPAEMGNRAQRRAKKKNKKGSGKGGGGFGKK